GPTTATVIANDAVTSAKIANGTIAAADLNQMGAANDQILKWNGTAWAPATDNTGSAVADTDANDGLTDFNAATGYNINVDDTTIEIFADALQIKDNAITSSKIAAGAVSGGPGGAIAVNSIRQGDIAPDAIGSSELDADSVGESELKDGAVTTDKILDGTIANVDILAGAAIDGSKINPVFTANVSTTGTLFVNGSISTGTDGQVHPDYVFEKYFLGSSNLKNDYDFQSLSEIEDFVKKFHHLPGIKSAEEIKKDGFWNLSESNLQNLEKIEELFLHTIEQEKKIQELRSKNEMMSIELKSLRKDLEEIKAILKKQ
ncbi:hypothetical protein OO009_15670, partial [Flavobacteriaceae bacterium KMM 6897]|nr:hypothetical protein [Flavobacteriaceae bacterium KMM 6897]